MIVVVVSAVDLVVFLVFVVCRCGCYRLLIFWGFVLDILGIFLGFVGDVFDMFLIFWGYFLDFF